MEIMLEKVKKVFVFLNKTAKGLVSLIRGENKDMARKLVITAAVLFVVACVFLSLRALAEAKKGAK